VLGEAMTDEPMFDGRLHAELVGYFVGNLQRLELLLRLFLCRAANQEIRIPNRPGEVLPVSCLNNWASLEALINQYNAELTSDENQFKLKSDIAIIRGAMAHGRILSLQETGPLRLYRFSRERSDRTVVTQFINSITESGIRSDNDMIIAETFKVVSCGMLRQYFANDPGEDSVLILNL